MGGHIGSTRTATVLADSADSNVGFWDQQGRAADLSVGWAGRPGWGGIRRLRVYRPTALDPGHVAAPVSGIVSALAVGRDPCASF